MEENKLSQEEQKATIMINDLYKSYGDKDVLTGLNLEVYEKELFGFIGRNGIGKSTTIDCMIGSKKFSKGEVYISGFDIKKYPLQAKQTFGYVASEPTCYEEMTGYDYLVYMVQVKKILITITNIYVQDFNSIQKNCQILFLIILMV